MEGHEYNNFTKSASGNMQICWSPLYHLCSSNLVVLSQFSSAIGHDSTRSALLRTCCLRPFIMMPFVFILGLCVCSFCRSRSQIQRIHTSVPNTHLKNWPNPGTKAPSSTKQARNYVPRCHITRQNTELDADLDGNSACSCFSEAISKPAATSNLHIRL